ncbi:ADP-ribose glycohydrolase MACROD2-like [Anneissia japonica]|uniref:ADP-ribose glycohydrolase MACROD2-like n=1 Tax=Anneissia japonica TaxID=1529436 RepID=UPI001425907D|nr:ADP-ribose glycohydrolase MACROD2-like [Anneissia japonica]
MSYYTTSSPSRDRMNATISSQKSYTSYSSLPRRTGGARGGGRIQRYGTPESPAVRGLMSQSAKFAGEYGKYGFQDGLEIYVFEHFLKMSLDDKRQRKKHKTFVELDEMIPWSEYALKEKIPKADEIYFRPNPKLNAKICLWEGDITSLCADAIVNPTNGTLMSGSGLNGEIHSRAGPLLREECREYPILPGKRMIRLETGYAIVTCGYWLPAKYVIHTVGPTVNDTVREIHENLLSSCYHECLDAVKTHNERYQKIHNSRQDELEEVEKNKKTLEKLGLESTEVDGETIPVEVEYSDISQGNVFLKPPIKSIAFPCISTGIYGYPSEKAADVALMTIRKWIDNPHNYNAVENLDMIIFCVMLNNDLRIYNDLIPKYFPIYDGKIRKTSHISSPARTKARVAPVMERKTNTNPTTEMSQKIQQTKITTFSSSPEAPMTKRVMPSIANRDNNRIPHNDHLAGEVPSNQEKGGKSHEHTDVIIVRSTSSQQQSTPPQDSKQIHVNQGSYTIQQVTPPTHSHSVNEPRSISFKPISPKPTQHNAKKAKNEKKKEDQFAKKEAKMLKKQQEKSAKRENKKAKKMQQLVDDFAPMDIEFDDDLLLAPTPVKNVPVLPPVVQKVSHSPVQRVVAPSPVHRLPTPSSGQHERGKLLTEGRTDFGKNVQTPQILTPTRDSIDSDMDYDDDENDDDMPPPPVSFDDDEVFGEDSFPPPPPHSLPPPLSDEETDSTPVQVPPMSVVTTIY